MTRFWILIFLAITHHSALFAQEFLPNDSIIQKRKVKTITQFDCDSTGNNCFIIDKKYYDTQGHLYRSKDYINSEVYLVTEYSYFKTNKIDTVFQTLSGQERKPVIVYKYDATGNITEQIQNSLNSEVEIRTVFTYSDAKQLLSEIVKQDNKTISEKKFFYDSSNNVIKTIEKYYPDGEPETTLLFYDRFNRISKIKYSSREEEYVYDDSQNLVKIIYHEFDNSIREFSLLTYSDKLLVSSITLQEKIVLSYIKYTYEFY
jgi:hypothetical protein